MFAILRGNATLHAFILLFWWQLVAFGEDLCDCLFADVAPRRHISKETADCRNPYPQGSIVYGPKGFRGKMVYELGGRRQL